MSDPAVAAYLRRKRGELELLHRSMGEEGPGELSSTAAVVAAKRRLRARLLARFFLDHEHLTESSLEPPAALLGRRPSLAYQYQRHDLLLRRSKPFLDRLYGAPLARGGPSFGLLAGSGMGAVSAALLALDPLVPEGTALHLAGDAYFETRQLAGDYLRRLRPTTLPPAAGGVLYLDSIAAADPVAATVGRELSSLRLLLVDTTCWDVEDRRLAALLARAAEAQLLTVLLRSHLKLDQLGYEYFRLGSLVLCLPPRPSPERVHLAKRLRGQALDLLSKTGALFLPQALLPTVEAAALRALSRERTRILSRNNRVAARLLARRAAPHGVDELHHGCFFILRPLVDTEVEVEARGRQLVARLDEAGLMARWAPSFAYDFIAVTRLTDRAARSSALRIALPDFPRPDLARFLTVAAAWLDGLLGGGGEGPVIAGDGEA